MRNDQIAAAFDQMADILEFQGANAFRVRAYRNAARTIRALHEPVAAIEADEDRKLTDISGIGKDLAEKIEALLKSGKLPQLEKLKTEVPQTALTLLRIPGLGPKKAAVLFKELKVTSLDALRAACEAEKVRELKGFGEKTEAMILAGLSFAEHAEERTMWVEADVIARALLDYMRQIKVVRRAELAGSYRRGKETIGDLDLLVDSDDVVKVMDHFGAFGGVAEVIARGETKMSVRMENGLQIDLRVVPKESFGAALQYFTGSKEHNVVLRGMAKSRGLKINEWGVYRIDGEKETYVAGETEADVYATLDLPWFPPEIREARQEFEWAEQGELPRLIEESDICGDLHMHTTETDGKASLEEMVEAARGRGLQYIAITDHSKRVSMANGLDPGRLRAQWKEIDKLNSELDGFVVLKGIECDILEKGGMDLPDDVLAEGDWIIASVHYGQNQSRQQITERILQAIENPHVNVVAHPTGRLINRRVPYEVDLDAVFKAAAAHGKMLELNANPRRLDLDDAACATARRLGIPIVISSDAHSTEGFAVLKYGVLQGRRGGLTRADVANARTVEDLRALIRKA